MAPGVVDKQAQVYVTNLREVRAWIRKFHPDLVPILRDELKNAVATTVIPNIRKNVPRRTGDAANSIRPVSGGNTVYVVAGNAKVPYFGWLDFGGALKPTGKRRGFQQRQVIKGGRYVYPGISQSSTQLALSAGRAVDRVLKQARN